MLNGLLAVSATRVVDFVGGRAAIEERQGYEHVVITGRHGEVVAISDCDTSTGTYDVVVQLARSLKAAVRSKDREAVAGLMMYPLRINTASGKGYFIKTSASLLKQYDAVFTAIEIRRIKQLEPYSVFCRNGMSTAGDGPFWAQASNRGKLRIAVINNGE